MSYADMIARATALWGRYPVCIFRFGVNEFGIAELNSPDCATLELTKGAQLLGTFKRPYAGAKASVWIGRAI